MPRLTKPRFAVLSSKGEVILLFCKICGTEIARMNKATRHLDRHENYTELKLQCQDGSFHVTNGCKTCLDVPIDARTLTDVLRADMQMEPKGYRDRDLRRSGISVVARGIGLL